MKLLDRLPKSYFETPYKTYNEILNTLPPEQPDDMDDDEWGGYVKFVILSKLLDVPVIDLERLPIDELLPLMSGIDYFDKDVQPTKNTLKIKPMHKLTYDEFVNYQKLRANQFNHTTEILMIVLEGKSEEEINNMSVSEVYEAFFMLNKSTKKSLTRLKVSLALTLVKQGWKMIVMKIKNLLK
jgi:hypothetical protein